MESAVPSLDDLLRRDLSNLDDEDVRLFFDYFDELKRHVRKYLRRKARQFPGDSAVAQSAFFSLLCDVAPQKIPLADVDEYGYPALWPLLLKYIERHCEKWNKYYRAKKRKGVEVPLGGTDSGGPGIDPPDERDSPGEEESLSAALETLNAKLTERQRRVADLSAAHRTLQEIASELQCSQSLVSQEKKKIRSLLSTL